MIKTTASGDVVDDDFRYDDMTPGEAAVAMYDNDTLPTLGDLAKRIDEAIASARLSALEEAAKIADEWAKSAFGLGKDAVRSSAKEIATAIRALKG